MAKAVVDAATQKNLEHEEMHSKVEYIVAHGIASTINEKRAVIGSAHFVFEDENCVISEGEQAKFDALPKEYSHLYLAIEGELAAVICIEDPLREEAADAIRALKESGISKVVMMTGDSDRTARAIAERVDIGLCGDRSNGRLFAYRTLSKCDDAEAFPTCRSSSYRFSGWRYRYDR